VRGEGRGAEAGAGALGVSGSGAEGAPRASRGPALAQLQDWCIGVERPDALRIRPPRSVSG